MTIQLGYTYTDVITGYSGIAVAHCTYISGCNQTLLVPKAKNGERKDGEWIDDQRLTLNAKAKPIMLHNGATPGCDRQAPKR